MILVAFMRQVDATVEGKVKLIVEVHTAWNIIHQNTERGVTHSRDRLGFSMESTTPGGTWNSGNEHERVNKTREDNLR